MHLLQQIITSFVASVAFGIMFNSPKSALVKCGLIGMVGWVVYSVLVALDVNTVISTLIAALLIGVIGQSYAHIYKVPAIIFTAPSMIPLVPGGAAHDAVHYFVQDNYHSAVQLSIKVFLLSIVIAVGFILSEAGNQLYTKYLIRRKGMP